MTIKPIKTERDYHKALKEIEKLWEAEHTRRRPIGGAGHTGRGL
jgi:hypothetical protein